MEPETTTIAMLRVKIKAKCIGIIILVCFLEKGVALAIVGPQ